MIEAIQKPILSPQAVTPAEIYVCDACCCGDARFTDREPIEELNLALAQSLEEHGIAAQCPAVTTGCMGPCSIGNNVILAMAKKNLFFKRMNHKEEMQALVRWVKQLLDDPQAVMPSQLKNHLADHKTF
jgi:predicted metal-binding protein